MSNIEIRDLQKRFGEKKIFDHFSFTFQEGLPSCILGESGCGKTTLLRMILGLEKPDGGEITGVPEKVSVLFQEDRLCEDFTAVTNIRLAVPYTSKDTIRSELARLGFHEGKRAVRTLSGGERRRVSIVRSALYDSELYVLDEAFRGLDPQTRDLALAYMREKTKDKTVIIVTHDPEEAKIWGGQILRLG